MERTHYAQLLQPLLQPATGYARTIVRDRQHAQDAVQQAALLGLERLHTFDDTRSFREWWFAMLHNCCIDLLRADKCAGHFSIDALEAQPLRLKGEQEHDPGGELILAMAKLSADHQEILRLKYFGDPSYKELADALNIPQGTVMSRVQLDRIALTRKMKEKD
jgi:RNA polymerase sigma-70 factor, ECF subfamily